MVLVSLAHLLSAFWNVLFPPVCLGCNREGVWLCSTCSKGMHGSAVRWCPRCGTIVTDTEGRTDAHRHGFVPDRFLACVPYHTPWAERGIQQLKFHGVEQVATLFGSLLASCLRESLGQTRALVTHVPVHHRRFRERGFDQAAAVGRACARELGLPFVPLLRRTRTTAAQSSLDKTKRWKNVENAFALGTNADLRHRTVLLVDDVVTTGATLSAAAQPLRNAGASCILAATVAYSALERLDDGTHTDQR